MHSLITSLGELYAPTITHIPLLSHHPLGELDVLAIIHIDLPPSNTGISQGPPHLSQQPASFPLCLAVWFQETKISFWRI